MGFPESNCSLTSVVKQINRILKNTYNELPINKNSSVLKIFYSKGNTILASTLSADKIEALYKICNSSVGDIANLLKRIYDGHIEYSLFIQHIDSVNTAITNLKTIKNMKDDREKDFKRSRDTFKMQQSVRQARLSLLINN
jgi:hypothetical protein